MAVFIEPSHPGPAPEDLTGFSSSPDPLATSVNKENTFLRSSPLKATSPSPKKPRTTKILEEITFRSPQKSVARHLSSPVRSQTEKSLSPWKIRVTVEAEPEEGFSGTGRGHSRTIKIPILDESTKQKQPRARSRSTSRPRQSREGRRASTASGKQDVGNASGSMRRLTDLDPSFLENEDVREIKPSTKRGGRRSEKSFGNSVRPPTPSYTSNRTQRSFNGLQSPATTIDGINAHGAESAELPVSPEKDSPELRELDPNHVCFRRSGRLKNGQPMIQHEPNGTLPSDSLAKPPTNGTFTKDHSSRDDLGSSMITYPTPDPSVQDELESGALKVDAEDVVEFDTVLESEGFTMIDIESLPSARQFITSPTDFAEQGVRPQSQEKTSTKEQPSSQSSRPSSLPRPSWTRSPASDEVSQLSRQQLILGAARRMSPEETEPDLISNATSSHSVLMSHDKLAPPAVPSILNQAHTPPTQAECSPKVPSPPFQLPKTARSVRDESSSLNPPLLSRVVKAGIVLQGLLSPKPKTPSPKTYNTQKDRSASGQGGLTPQERLDDIFNGFDPATRRELRAGLRFGEELARRQRLSSPTANVARTSDSPLHADQACETIAYLDSAARERRWQLEREAVSQQIENASTSQVIMIDSDDEEDDLERTSEQENIDQSSPAKSAYSTGDEDIWLAEADSAQISSRDIEDSLFTRTQQFRQRERAKEIVSKPRRTLIPSPWKRGHEVESTFLSNGDASGVFWNHPQGSEKPSSTSRLPLRKDVPKTPKTPETSLDSVIDEILLPEADVGLKYDDSASLEQVSHDEQSSVGSENEDTAGEIGSQHLPMQVPVKFNDSSEAKIDFESESSFDENWQPSPSASSPCPPPTPRSALKGSRASLPLQHGEAVIQSPRKVLFSRQSFCLDESGLESCMQVRGGTLSFESSQDSLEISNHTDGKDQSTIPTENDAQGSGFTSGSEISKAAPAPWLSRWTTWGAKSAALPASKPSPPTTATTTTNKTNPQPETPSPASPSTTPRRDSRLPPPPSTLSTFGYFTDDHFKHLHILYLKSLKSSFTLPESIRPAIATLVDQQLQTGDGQFAWAVTTRDAQVVERWFRMFEGRGAREVVRDWDDEECRYRRLGWSEREICVRLCQILVGQEVKKERKDQK